MNPDTLPWTTNRFEIEILDKSYKYRLIYIFWQVGKALEQIVIMNRKSNNLVSFISVFKMIKIKSKMKLKIYPFIIYFLKKYKIYEKKNWLEELFCYRQMRRLSSILEFIRIKLIASVVLIPILILFQYFFIDRRSHKP